MANRITYYCEPQAPSPKGWRTCLPHQAGRWAVLQVTNMRKRKGHPIRTTRLIATFSGAGAKAQAEEACASLTRRSKPRPAVRQVIARSLTRLEYNALMDERSSNA